MQKCKKCGETKTKDSFYKQKRMKNGIRSLCKSCWNKISSEYYREYYINNREKLREKKKEWSKKNIDKIREYKKKEYNKRNNRKWRRNNRDKINEYNRRRSQSNPKIRVDDAMRRGIHRAIGDKKNGRGWEKFVDYSLDDLVKHLEAQFEDWMTWENYGEWHIDHIKPQSLFNYTKPEDPEFKECWSLDNLQPLERMENIKKSNNLYYKKKMVCSTE